jgi:hypothetical protein
VPHPSPVCTARRSPVALSLALCVAPSVATGDPLVRTCLPGEARSQGLAARVDPDGQVHLSRVDRLTGDVLHTVVGPDGRAVDTVVALAASRLALDEITVTGLTLIDDAPAICYRNPRAGGFFVAWRGDDGFATRRVAAAADAGRDCGLVPDGAGLRVFWTEAGKLRTATLAMPGGAPIDLLDLDAPAGRSVGHDLDAQTDAAGAYAVVHHDAQGALRLTYPTPGGPRTEVIHPGSPAAGIRPTLVFGDDGQLFVAHGGSTPRLDAESDAGLYETVGRPGGPFTTAEVFGGFGGGGQAALRTAEGRALFARERQRSALFGAYDALWFFVDAGAGLAVNTPLEQATAAASRHDYGPLAATVDPFGEPVLVYGDSRSATIVSPATAPTCLYRRLDTDGDALPDVVEGRLGTDPLRADTDGDGTSDGVEVLRLGTDPNEDDTCVPSPEVCDAVDNDCDGETDEDTEKVCYTGPPGTAGVGPCLAGRRACVAGALGDCLGAVLPTPTDALCDGRDEDCDGTADDDYAPTPTTCGQGACAAAGRTACIAGGVQDTCLPRSPSPDDARCDGLDDDCDGAIDEDAEPWPTDCGEGACAATGALICADGEPVDTCRPGAPLADADTTCDGNDDDCDGAADEDYVPVPTDCGAGACTAEGALICEGGRLRDTCRAAAGPAGDDAICDGVDDDCDGTVDEDASAQPAVCGRGVCERSGVVRCERGAWVLDCQPGPPLGLADGCDGVDDDCDGETDEDALARPAICGLGLCRRDGVQRCVDGRLETLCAPSDPPAADDAVCDGLDEDCDGRVDEDALPRETACGQGVCQRAGVATCESGRESVVCTPGEPGAARDETCDGLDDDCDGLTDEDFVGERSDCGVGVCRVEGRTTCVDGRLDDICLPLAPAPEAVDDDCNGLDDDCDGAVDEAFVPGPTLCGHGACESSGERLCVDGMAFDTCLPDAAAPDDATCDGLDDDCDGATDEDAGPVATACGAGVCTAIGTRSCVDGRLEDTCAPGEPDAALDATCDGRDDDCDGAVDEEAAPSETVCGIGACAATGERQCVDGAWADTCAPGRPAAVSDRTCDGRDDDCDGQNDEDFRGALTNCGQGVCAARGRLRCVAGIAIDDCSPGRPSAPTDTLCDGRDDDCDGAVDEDAPLLPTTCGRGACARTGESMCTGGQRVDTCVAGPSAADDATCDGLDDDCDGTTDEDFVGSLRDCGAGACRRTIREVCVEGQAVGVCVSGPPAADDATCDGVDDDCDGATDEDTRSEATTCGAGLCAAVGTRACIGGRWQDDCRPTPPAVDAVDAVDDDCDGLDDDCDGSVDEAFAPEPTSCGTGACAGTGTRICLEGRVQDTCRPGERAPGANDDDCNGRDDDCDGALDEGFVGGIEACGIGACRAEAPVVCISGRTVSTCRPLPAAASDATCDGVDDDCDGRADEDFVPRVVDCTPGMCRPTGRSACVDGLPVDDCDAPPAASTDETCDGIDDDCDGTPDDETAVTPLPCGVGACATVGERRCEGGVWRDRCEPGRPAPDDASCDGRDDDCDGVSDEDALSRPTTCGAGICAAEGTATCRAGAWVDDCRPGASRALDDGTCDGLDDDCDGLTDEDAAPDPSACGAGACAAVGTRSCEAGRWVDDCRPQPPLSANDATCDGHDDDCDGATDEDVVSQAITCGVGVCARAGTRRCVDGRFLDACTAEAPRTPIDATCDGVDDDCDGATDEDVPRPVEGITCGLGACRRDGERRCEGGHLVERCTPGPAAADDATCNGRDDDCDGETDEDVIAAPSSCGQGVCAARGERRCEAGRWTETCRPGRPIGDDRDCDGLDQDCDGRADDGFDGTPVLCGEGACGRIGETACVEGAVVERCTPGAPSARDATCDAVDDDCDGTLDEDAPRAASACGQGVCASAGETVCVDGAWVDTCMPGRRRSPSDATCDGLDDDCDGLVDEECVPGTPDAAITDAAQPPADARLEGDVTALDPDGDGPAAGDATSSLPDADPPKPDGAPAWPDTGDAQRWPPADATTEVPPLPDAAFDPWPEASVSVDVSAPNPRIDCGCRAGSRGTTWPIGGLFLLPVLRRVRRRRRDR